MPQNATKKASTDKERIQFTINTLNKDQITSLRETAHIFNISRSTFQGRQHGRLHCSEKYKINTKLSKTKLPITFREGDAHAQPGEQPIEDRAWATPTRRGPWTLGMGLARRLREAMATDPSQGFEHTIEPGTRPIPLDFRVENPETAIVKR
jgi:hypothetical protein